MSDIVAIIQARMGSRRLPGKVLLEIAGQPMLWHVVQQARRATALTRVVVATSTAAADDAIEAFCHAAAIHCVRGSEQDVLDRYRQAADALGAAIIVRLTADCPLLDPAVIDKVVHHFLAGAFAYVSNVDPPTFPDGLDTEVFTYAALHTAWQEATRPSEREHVTPYIRQHPERFRLGNVQHSPDLSGWRWTVDEAVDLDFVRAVYARLGVEAFGMHDVCQLLTQQPGLRQMNAHLQRNAGYHHSLRQEHCQ
ncbi:MAG: NTP transferase domain-containing protein [Candidatus Tectimicrobiota bacterium]